jgi:hypothetical protein
VTEGLSEIPVSLYATRVRLHLDTVLVGTAVGALLLSACQSEAPPPVEPASEASAVENAPEETSTCAEVEMGYIVQAPDGVFEVCPQSSSYVASSGTMANLPSRDAQFGLSGYGLGQTESAITLNHPASGASDGTRLAVADRFNNRVLVFSTLPSGPSEPDLVLGQPDFIDTTPGDGLADMNWPGAVEMTPDGKLLVADTENGRVLVYGSVPETSGASADFALDLAALSGSRDAWPWGIWSDGQSLVVTDTRMGNILVWDTFPENGNQRPSSVSNPVGAGTPRNITSDGSSFLIGDENGSQQQCWGQETQNRQRQSHVWVNRLPVGEPDGCVWDWYQGDTLEGGLLALAAGGQDAHFWPSFPVDEQTALNKSSTGSQGAQAPPPGGDPQGGQGQPGQPGEPGAEPPPPGQPDPGAQPAPDGQSNGEGPLPPSQGASPSESAGGHSYLGGDGGDVVVTDSAIFFIEYNGNRVTAWNEMPQDILGKSPDFSVFDSDPEVSTLLRDGFIQNPVLVNAGGSLVATSDYDRRMYVWNSAPGENGASADYVYLTGFPAWDNSYADGVLVIAGHDSVAVWNSFQPGNLPDEVLKGTLGTFAVNDIRGVAFDGTYFAVSDPQSEVVAVFEGIPTAGQEPFRTYSLRGPGRLDMNDGILAIAPKEGSEILVVDVTGENAPTLLPVRTNLPTQVRFLPIGFGIADTSFHRVQLWKSLADAQAGLPPDTILGGEAGERPQTTDDRFYFPASLEVVAGHLYVGEFKFSNRILAFSE